MSYTFKLGDFDHLIKDGNIKPSELANGNIFLYHSGVVSIQGFTEWITTRMLSENRSLNRFINGKYKDDIQLLLWLKIKEDIFRKSYVFWTNSGHNLNQFEVWIRNNYESSFISQLTNISMSHSESDSIDAEKSAYCEILTNFVAALFLDTHLTNSKNKELSQSHLNFALFPPKDWLKMKK